MKSRTPIPKAIKEQVINRNGGKFCEKCGRKKHLHFHHIIPVRDGGTNSLDNLAILCFACHHEWHSVNKRKPLLSLNPWIDWTPIYAMLSAFKAMGLLRADIKDSAFAHVVAYCVELRYPDGCTEIELILCAFAVAESPLFLTYPPNLKL